MRNPPKIGATCTDCGKVAGEVDENEDVHCANCGSFAESTPEYCPKHGFDTREHRTYDECPKCREARLVEQQRQEQMERRANPRMHNSVDARRF